MDEIDCIIIMSNAHVFARKQVNISMTILKRCQLVKMCQIVTPKYEMLKFKKSFCVYDIKHYIIVNGNQTLDNLCSMKLVDSQQR